MWSLFFDTGYRGVSETDDFKRKHFRVVEDSDCPLGNEYIDVDNDGAQNANQKL